MLQFIFAPGSSQAITQGGITVNSRWWGEHIDCEVVVTRGTDRDVSYAGGYHAFAGTVPQWKFLDQFQPMPVKRKKMGR